MNRFRGLALLLSMALIFTTVDEAAITAWADQPEETHVFVDEQQSDVSGDELAEDIEGTIDSDAEEGFGEDTLDIFEAKGTDDTSGGDAGGQSITVTFYDTDGTTVLEKIELQYSGKGSVMLEYQQTNGYCLPSFQCLQLYNNGYYYKRWKDTVTGELYTARQLCNLDIDEDQSYIIVYQPDPYEYKIKYNLNKGEWTEEQKQTLKETFTVKDDFAIEKPRRQGYFFDGWFLDEDFTMPVERINSTCCINGNKYLFDENGGDPPALELYAKYSKTPTLTAPVIDPDIEHTKASKTAVVKLDTKNQWVELCITTDKNFEKNLTYIDLKPETTSLTLQSVAKKKTYYFRAKAFVVDSTGERYYSDVSNVASRKMTYGLTESSPKTSSGKISTIAIQEDKKTLLIEAAVSKRLKSYDELYYLAEINPSNDKLTKIITSTLKAKKIAFELPATDELLDKKFALFVQKSAGKYSRVSAGKYISNPERLHSDPSLAVPKITGVENVKISKSLGDIVITMDPVSNVDGKEICFSTDAAFSKGLTYVKLKPGEREYTLYNMPKSKVYYFRARSYVVEVSTGDLRYGDYDYNSTVKSKKAKFGVTESSVSTSAGKICKVEIKEDKKTVRVETNISKRVKSYDEYYYLVAIDPVSGACSEPLASTLKATTGGTKKQEFEFELPVKDDAGTNLIQKKFALAVQKSKGTYKRVSAGKFIANPEMAAGYTAPFPTTPSKKGAQGSRDTSLNIHHTFQNVWLDEVLSGDTPYTYNGTTYYFSDKYSGMIADANAKGMTTTYQIMMRWSDSKSYTIYKPARKKGAPTTPYYALNAQEKKGREELEAAFAFLAERYSRPDCHVDNWILGNEVNAFGYNKNVGYVSSIWNYSGNVSRSEYVKNYADCFRILYYAVKSNSENSRVYICTDHTWTDFGDSWGARDFMTQFNTAIKKQNSKIQWNLAFHSYPADLSDAKVWEDDRDPRFVCNSSPDSHFVSACNLDVMTNYVKQKFGTKTRVILSEVGFTQRTGQDIQAAAVAYSYYKAEFNSMVDSIMLHLADERQGGGENYSLGKGASDVFKYMNTPSYKKYTDSCLGTIGVSSWKDVTESFDSKKLTAMPEN